MGSLDPCSKNHRFTKPYQISKMWKVKKTFFKKTLNIPKKSLKSQASTHISEFISWHISIDIWSDVHSTYW